MRLAAFVGILLFGIIAGAHAQLMTTGVGPGAFGGGGSCYYRVQRVSGPSGGAAGVASTNFTLTLIPSGAKFNGSQTITIADGSQGGTITPSVGSSGTSTVTVTPANLATGFTFTYNPATSGAKTLTFTNAQGWTNQTALTYTATDSFTVTGPTTGAIGVASTNFTVTLANGTKFNGSQTITIADGSQGGTITPSVGIAGHFHGHGYAGKCRNWFYLHLHAGRQPHRSR